MVKRAQLRIRLCDLKHALGIKNGAKIEHVEVDYSRHMLVIHLLGSKLPKGCLTDHADLSPILNLEELR